MLWLSFFILFFSIVHPFSIFLEGTEYIIGLLSFLVGIYVNAYVEISVEVKIENISITKT
jgi:hypothetical protein